MGTETSDLLRLGSETAGGLGLGEAVLVAGGGTRTEEGGRARVEEGGGRGFWMLCTSLGTLQLFKAVARAEVAVAEGCVYSEAPAPPPLGGLWTPLVIELETSTVPPAFGGVAGVEGVVVMVAGKGSGAVAAAAHSLRLSASFFSLETPGEEQAEEEVVAEEAPL